MSKCQYHHCFHFCFSRSLFIQQLYSAILMTKELELGLPPPPYTFITTYIITMQNHIFKIVYHQNKHIDFVVDTKPKQVCVVAHLSNLGGVGCSISTSQTNFQETTLQEYNSTYRPGRLKYLYHRIIDHFIVFIK